MALPTDSGDSFLREVDENLRRDQAQQFAKKNLPWIIGGVLLFLAAVGGYLFWQDRQQRQAAEESERMAQIFRDIGAGKTQNAAQRLEQEAEKGGDVTAANARFAKAAVALQNNDRAGAIAEFGRIASDADLPDAYRDLATIRRTAIEFDTLKPEEVVARLQPLAKAGNPWFGAAGELSAMALLKQGKKNEAGRLFAAIAADAQVPASIRSRSAQIAGTLGVDASASMPTIVNQGQ